MRSTRIKFIWGASNVIQGRWHAGLFGFYDRGTGRVYDGLAISVRGALAWAVVCLAILWAAAAATAFWIWKKNPYSLVTYSDAVLYPWRRAEIAQKQGKAFIAEGHDLFRAEKWFDAAEKLRLGLARYPRDLRARLTLAEFHALVGQRAVALRILNEGLDAEYPGRPYLQTLLDTAEQGEDFEYSAQASGRYLAELKRNGPAADYAWLLERRFGALLASGRAAEALAFAETEESGASALEHRVLALSALGRQADATKLLKTWATHPGSDRQQIARLRVRTAREEKNTEEMDAALKDLRASASNDPAAAGFAVVQQALAAREREASAALTDYLVRFGGTAENLALVASPLAELAQVELLQQCVRAAEERGYPLYQFQALQVQALVQRGEWPAARTLLAKMIVPAAREAELWSEWMRRLLEVAIHDNDVAQRGLIEFMRARPLPLQTFVSTADVLRRTNRLQTAKEILGVAKPAYPASKSLSQLIDDVNAQLASRPIKSVEPAAGSIVRVISEQVFMQRLAELVQAANWNDASRHLQQMAAVRPAPEWWTARDAEIRLAQVRIAHGTNDRVGMLTAARVFLNGDDARSRQLLDVARQIDQHGDRPAAVVLGREVLRRTPEFAPATRLIAEWAGP